MQDNKLQNSNKAFEVVTRIKPNKESRIKDQPLIEY